MDQPPGSSGIADVLDRILDKGIVVDSWARVSVVSIKNLTVEARMAAASMDTFLHYARSITQMEQSSQSGDPRRRGGIGQRNTNAALNHRFSSDHD